MGENYILSCSSTADLTKEQFEKLGIRYIYCHYELDGKDYPDDLGQTMPFDKFYDAMRNGADTKTYQINSAEYIEYFTPFLEEGKDILHLTLSSGISGIYNSACLAAEELSEKYPDRKIYIVDSLAASGGYGLLMDKLAELKNGGMEIDELHDWAEANKLRVRHWFFSSDLTFFIKGGRISKTSGFIGNVLNICPLMDVSFEGTLIPRFKIRTKKKVIQEIVKKMEEQADGGHNYNDKVFITHADCKKDADAVASLIDTKFPNKMGEVRINYIGTTIGSHTGPGTVALFYWGDKRID